VAETFRYLLGPHGVFEGTPDEVLARGYDPWQTQLFDEARNRAQFGDQRFTWSGYGVPGGADLGLDYAVGYLPTLLDLRAKAQTGQISELERWQYDQMVQEARAIPLRDIGGLTYDAGSSGTGAALSGASPDLGGIMLQLADKIDQGRATPEERSLFTTTNAALREQNWRASVPQPSDAFNPLGDNLMGALGIIGLGAGASAALAPLYAGAGLTLGSVGGLAGAASGVTNMLGQALDQDWLTKASMALGIAGGAAGLAGMLQNGLTSVGDVVKAVQKTYGVASKTYQAVAGGPSGGGQASDTRTSGRTVSSTSAADGAGGTGMDFSQLGTILTGVVGAVGAGMSLDDASRYMNQLKDQFKDDQRTKDLIDQAYQLAAARYDTFYAQTQEQHQQAQAAYQDALGKYQTHYQQTQQEQGQRQAAYQKGEGQIDEDRATQYEHYRDQRAKYDQSYQQKVQEAAQDRDRRISVFGEDRQIAMADYNRRVAEANQDRQKEYATFDQQFARHMSTQDKREFEAAQERGLDLNAYVQRQAIGANLADPTKIKAGAEAIYQPLSELARQNISTQVQAEMAQRGVAGGGQYANLMSAKAFAPSEQALWQNALQAYLTGQQGAVNAYGQQDMTGTPGYQWVNVPNFTNSPEYKYTNVPEMGGVPQYQGTNVPNFVRTGQGNVPGTVGISTPPGVPSAISPGYAPQVNRFSPKPYAPYEGKDKGVSDLVSNLTRALTGGGAGGAAGAAGGLFGLVKQLFGGGGNLTPEQTASITNELQRSMNTNNDLWGFGGGGNPTQYAEPIGPGLGWDAGGYYGGGSATFDEAGNWGGAYSDYMPMDTSQWDWSVEW